MTTIMEKQQSHAPNRGAVVDSDIPQYEDALFVVHVMHKESSAANTVTSPAASSDVLTAFMPSAGGKSYSLPPLVISDGRGGVSARQPSRVQLFTKSGVSIALFSHTLAAEAVVDAFISCRERHIDDPRARAAALKDMLRDLHNEEHTFSFALFDDSARAFVAWTPRSAPLSFGHHLDGSVVVVGSLPRSKTLVGRQLNGDVHLAHLPAGRFVYGHAFLKPFEFTSMWSTATGNRAGASAQVRLGLVEQQREAGATPPGSPNSSFSSTSAASSTSVDHPAVFDLDKPKLSPVESSKWRWAKTGSRAEVADTWKKTVTAVVVAESKKEEEESKTTTTTKTTTTRVSAASQIAAIAETVAALAAKASNETNNIATTTTSANNVDWAAWPKENPILVAVASKKLVAASAPAPASASAWPEQLLTFGVGAVICNLMNRGGPRINRFDTHADKRFLTLLLLRFAVLTEKPFVSSEERREQMLSALNVLEPLADSSSSSLQVAGALALGRTMSFGTTMRKTAEGWFTGEGAPGAAANKRAEQLKAATRRRRKSALPVALHDGNNSSIVVCQPNGTCCVGSHCFV